MDTMDHGSEAGDPTAPGSEVGAVEGEPGAANEFGDAGHPDGGELGGEGEFGGKRRARIRRRGW